MEEKENRVRQEKVEAPEVAEQSKLLRWLENFWYHYKWHTILIAFVLFVCIGCFAQCATAEESDVTVALAANYSLTSEQMSAIVDVLGAVCPQDYDGDGKKDVAVHSNLIFSEEQLIALNTHLDPVSGEYKRNETDYQIDKSANADRITTLRNYIMTGESAVWLVSPYVYETMLYNADSEHNWVRQAVPLKETAIYAYYDVLKALPEDTLLVLTVSPFVGDMSKETSYGEAVAYYETLLSFSTP